MNWLFFALLFAIGCSAALRLEDDITTEATTATPASTFPPSAYKLRKPTKPTQEITDTKAAEYINETSLKCSCKIEASHKEATVDFVCCNIEEPSYVELDWLRQDISLSSNQDGKMKKLQTLVLLKSDIYSFLFDTDHTDLSIETIHNSDFVVGYFRRGSDAQGVHHNNGHQVKNLYLSYGEMSPEMLYLLLENLPNLQTLHLDHVRLIPYPPGPAIPSDILNIVLRRFLTRPEKSNSAGLVLSLVDLRIQSIDVPEFVPNSTVGYSPNAKKLSLQGLTSLRMLSLAKNLIEDVSNLTAFLPKDAPEFWYLDLSDNKIREFDFKLLPSTIRHLNLRGNPVANVGLRGVFFKNALKTFTQIEELWIDDTIHDSSGKPLPLLLGRHVKNDDVIDDRTTNLPKTGQTATTSTATPPKSTLKSSKS